jgi:hypothetical protein
VLKETLCKYKMYPLGHNQKHTFYRNGKTSCSDILNANKQVCDLHKCNKVLNIFSASNHLYVVHTFNSKIYRGRSKFVKFSTKDLWRHTAINKAPG